MSNLELSNRELQELIRENDDRFEVLYDDIPKEGHSSQYIEDDGRQLRYFEFKDLATDKICSFSYVWHVDYESDFPYAFLGEPQGFTFVKDKPIEKSVEVKESTPADIEKERIWKDYRAVESEVKDFSEVRDSVPASAMEEVINFLNNNEFSYNQLCEKILPVCVEYKIEQKSFWTAIQRMRGVWK